MISEEQLDYWEQVIQGKRLPDPADGIDLPELAQWVIDDLREALKQRDAAILDAAYQQTMRQQAEEAAAREFEFRGRMEAEWNEMMQERDEARERARDYLPCVKHQYDSPDEGHRFEREQRAAYPWLGPGEPPLQWTMMQKADAGQWVQHEYLGRGQIVEFITTWMVWVRWDKTPSVDYNLGANPSIALVEDLTFDEPEDE